MNLKGQGNSKQAFWLAIGYFSSLAVGIGSAVILSRYFNKAEYGTYRQIIYVYNTLLIVFSAGLPKVYAYFLPKYTIEEGRYIVKKITKLLLYLGTLFSICLFLGADIIATILKNPDLSIGLKVFSPVPFLMLPTLGLEGIYSTYKNTRVIAIYNTLTKLLMLFFIVFPVIYFEGSYFYALYGWIAVSIISFIIALILKDKPFKNIQQKTPIFSNARIFKYSLPILTASIAGIAISSSNQFFISRYFGMEEFAIFSNGFVQLPFVVIVSTSIGAVLMPQISKLHDSNKKDIGYIYKAAILNSAILLYPIISFFMVYSDEIIIILFSEKYKESGFYFIINLILNYTNIIIFAPILLGLGASGFYSKIHIYAAITLWISTYGAIVIYNNPYAVVVVFLIINLGLIFFSIRKIITLLNMNLNELLSITKLIKIISHSLICALATYFLSNTIKLPPIGTLFISFFCYTTLLLVSDLLVKNMYIKKYKAILNKIFK